MAETTAETWIDPVCGMTVPADRPHRAEHAGRSYVFCCERCRGRFAADPGAFLPGRLEDPVCGMTARANTPHRHDHGGTRYAFCSARCRQRFAAEPDATLARRAAGRGGAAATAGQRAALAVTNAAATAVASAAVLFTCPMHPEVLSEATGDCPDCGMALEAVAGAPAVEAGAELAAMMRWLYVAAAFTAPLVVLAMGSMHAGSPFAMLPAAWRHIAELLLALPVCTWAAWPFHARALRSLRSGRLNMFTLIGLGVTVTFAYSMVAALLPGLFPPAMHQHDGAPAVYFEAAAVIVTLVLLGQVMELRARARTGEALRSLLALAPDHVRRVDGDGVEREVPLAAIAVGERLRVRAGERIPVDGVIVDGSTGVDESLLTGESLPVHRHAGDAVSAGTRNGSGSVVIAARSVGAATLLARIVALTAAAQRSRAPIQQLADRVAAWFVPGVLAVAAITFSLWLWLAPAPALPFALQAAVAVLVIACPCALGLATPMSIVVATARGAGMGVLFRDAAALQVLARVDVLVVDKTGTLTAGKPRLTAVEAAPGFGPAQVLRAATALERGSEHPLAAAFAAGSGTLDATRPGGAEGAPEAVSGAPAAVVSGFVAHAGAGVEGRVDGQHVLLGSAPLLASAGIDVAPLAARADGLRTAGATALFCAIDGRLGGVLGVADPIRETTAPALAALRADGVDIVMLTGDHATTAAAVAGALGITTWRSGMAPAQKHAHIAEMKQHGHVVAMAGDGINDAPALALADVGIAMGGGSDVAIENAAVTLVRGDLRAIARARRLSRATLRNIRQNLFFAFAYNTASVPVAAGLLYPLTGWLLSPMLAAAAMSLSSVCVIANALRLRATPL
jgi:Cu+-exporting ATPase